MLSAVLANDIVCLADDAAFWSRAARGAGSSPCPSSLGLACAANVGSAATLIGNPQNMLIGQRLGLSFAGYLADAAVPAALGLAIVWAVVAASMTGRWHAETAIPEVEAPALEAFQAAKGIAVLAAMMAAFLFAPWPREIVALAAAGVMLTSRPDAQPQHARRGGLAAARAFHRPLRGQRRLSSPRGCSRARWPPLGGAGIDVSRPAWLFGVTVVLSNLVSNVPATMLLLPAATHPLAGPILALASTLAGNLLIVGSIANIIVVEQAHRLGVRVTWLDHAKVGVPVTLATLAVAAAWLALRASM